MKHNEYIIYISITDVFLLFLLKFCLTNQKEELDSLHFQFTCKMEMTYLKQKFMQTCSEVIHGLY